MRALFALCLLATVSMPRLAVGQPAQDSRKVFSDVISMSREFFAELRDAETGLSGNVSAPSSVSYAAVAGSAKESTLSIDELHRLLIGCRRGSFSVGGSQSFPGKTVASQTYECSLSRAPNGVLRVEAAAADDGKSVVAVKVFAGGAMRWKPPAPSQSVPQENDADAMAIVDRFPVIGAPIVDGVSVSFLNGGFGPLPAQSFAHILQNCRRVSGFGSTVTVGGGKQKKGIYASWKCDQRSSADYDISTWFVIEGRRISFIQARLEQDYTIPEQVLMSASSNG